VKEVSEGKLSATSTDKREGSAGGRCRGGNLGGSQVDHQVGLKSKERSD